VICAACLDEDEAHGRDHYLRYSWAHVEALVCARHRQHLRSFCGRCFSRAGFRFHCFAGKARLICVGCSVIVSCGKADAAEPKELTFLLALADAVSAGIDGDAGDGASSDEILRAAQWLWAPSERNGKPVYRMAQSRPPERMVWKAGGASCPACHGFPFLAPDDHDRCCTTPRPCRCPAALRAAIALFAGGVRTTQNPPQRRDPTPPHDKKARNASQFADRRGVLRARQRNPGKPRLESGSRCQRNDASPLPWPAHDPGAGSGATRPSRRPRSSSALTEEACHLRPPRGVRSCMRSS
jgi:hypothetical protein